MEVIPLKIQGEMLAVRSTSHHKMYGTKCCLEHLMRHHGLRSVRNSYRTCEATFSHVEIKKHMGLIIQNQKPHFFSLDRREKNRSFKGLL